MINLTGIRRGVRRELYESDSDPSAVVDTGKYSFNVDLTVTPKEEGAAPKKITISVRADSPETAKSRALMSSDLMNYNSATVDKVTLVPDSDEDRHDKNPSDNYTVDPSDGGKADSQPKSKVVPPSEVTAAN